MKSNRRLALRREVLAELDAGDLRGFAGGQPETLRGCVAAPTRDLCGALTLNTCFSCLTYISCNPAACVVRDAVEYVTTIQTR